MSPQSIPETPKRFGAQFYTDPEFFLNQENDEWMADPEKTVMEGSMMGGVLSDILSSAKHAGENPSVPAGALPTQEELTTSVGAVGLSSISEMLNIVGERHMQRHPGGIDAGVAELLQARDLGLQGARDWWAGNVAGSGGGGHAPRSGHETELPPIQFSDQEFEPDPHMINTDTTVQGHLALVREYGIPNLTVANDLVIQTLRPMSDLDLDPDDFAD